MAAIETRLSHTPLNQAAERVHQLLHVPSLRNLNTELEDFPRDINNIKRTATVIGLSAAGIAIGHFAPRLIDLIGRIP